MNKGSNEARVGAVVLVALATLGGGYTFLTRQSRGGEMYHLQIQSGVATIRPGSDVMFRGVKIGEVRKVALDPKTQNPLLTLAIQDNDAPVHLRRDYEYSIRAGSFIGENYVDIRTVEGKPRNSAPTTNASFYAPNSDNPNDVIAATAPGGITDLTSQATLIGDDFRQTLNRFNTTLDSLNKGVLSTKTQLQLAQAVEGVAKLTRQAGQGFGPQGIKVAFGDAQSQRALNETLTNAAQASRDAAIAARNINALTESAKGVTRKFDTLATNAGTLTSNAAIVAANAGTLTRGLSGVVQENRGQLRGLLTNLNGTARNVSGLTESLAFVLNQGGFKENSQVAFRSLRRAAENVEVGTQGLRVLGDPQTQKTLRDTLGSIRDATGALRDTAVTVSKAIGDPSTQQELKTTLSSLAGTAQALQGTVQNLNEISGSLKNVVADPQTQNNLKETVANLNGTLIATRAAAERVNGLLGGKKPRRDKTTPTSTPNDTTSGTPNGTPNNASSTGSSGGTKQGDTKQGDGNDEKKRDRAGSDFPQGVDFTLRHYTNVRGHNSGGDDARTFGDLTLNANLFKAPFRLGLSGLGEGNNLTLQTGKYLGSNAAVRYGLYRSKLGIGAEIRKGRFSLEGNFYDPNHRSYNAYAGLQLTPQLEILAGREERFGVRSNSIAVRLRQ